MYDAVCSKCGAQTQVPFKPVPGREVFCKECFQKLSSENQEGFEINLVISSIDSSYLNFIKYLYDEKISTIEYLNNCIMIW